MRFTAHASVLSEVLASGEAGMLIVFNASIWHGHTANVTENLRRSVQGYFCAGPHDQAQTL
jgi:ectoine hydroxylase-related dioxygenase (phytanoyl-CoA dioxygenase family)